MSLVCKIISVFLLFCFSNSMTLGESEVMLDGDFVQGGLVYGNVAAGSAVFINNSAVRVSSAGDFIIGFGHDYPSEAELLVIYNNGINYSRKIKIAARNYDIQRINGLPDKAVNPNKKALKRIKQESNEIARARNLNDSRVDFKTKFIWPVVGPISGVYGSQRILNGQSKRPHFGIDIVAPVGSPIVAPAPGLVTYVNEDMYFSGGTLVLDHGHNLSSSFLHLHKILVNVGDTVAKGQEIAEVGATGRVTGAHLDWRMNWHQQRIDPGLLMNEVHNINGRTE